MLLSVRDLHAGYGAAVALHGISFAVEEAEIVSVLGANGAGKTTALRVVSGLLPAWSGTVTFRGESIDRMPAQDRARRGLGHVPEGRGVLGPLTVAENLQMARAARRDATEAWLKDLRSILDLFPALADRLKERASALSGGQQQMLAIARALLARPKLLMIDELSFGLAPVVTNQIFAQIRRLRDAGTAFLLVEQNAAVLDLSDRTYVISGGKTVLEARSTELLGPDRERLARIYVGGSAPAPDVKGGVE